MLRILPLLKVNLVFKVESSQLIAEISGYYFPKIYLCSTPSSSQVASLLGSMQFDLELSWVKLFEFSLSVV